MPRKYYTSIELANQSAVKFFEKVAGGSNFVALEAPDAIAADVTWKLPNADGSANYLLKTDGSGNLGWASPSGVADTNRSVFTLENCSISATVGSNALTVALKDSAGNDPSVGSPVVIGFRSTTATDSAYVIRTVTSALSVVISSGSSLGTSNGVQANLKVYAIDNAGTVVLGVINGGLNEESVQSSTAEGGAGAADSAGVLYTTAAQTSKAVRGIANILVTEATAGTWATAPSSVSIIRPIGARNVVGDTSGTAVPTGMIGEQKQITGSFTGTTAWAAGSSLSLALTPGVWLLSATGSCLGGYATGAYFRGYIGSTQMTSGTGAPTGTTVGFDYVAGSIVSATGEGALGISKYVTISSNTTYYFGTRTDFSGTVYAGFQAVRIA